VAFFNAAGTDPRLRVTFPAVSCAVIKNLIGPPPAASRRPFWPGARPRQGHSWGFGSDWTGTEAPDLRFGGSCSCEPRKGL